jgi:amino acid adenylation domain-containing protein
MSELLHSHSMPIVAMPTASARNFAVFPKAEVEQSIPARFERQARLYPEQTAVADSKSTITYRDLNGFANRIAWAILAVCGKGSAPVALLIGNGAPVVSAMLGVLKAGKFYVPLDVSQPMPRTAAILAECRPVLLITDNQMLQQAEALRASCNPLGVMLLNLDAFESDYSEENPGLAISAADLAYVLYTSGSMGRPKGVMQDHRYVLHLTMVYTNSGWMSPRDRLALLYSPSFAGAVRDIYCALLNGAALVIFDVKREGMLGLAEWLRRSQITVIFAVATMFRHFCRLLTPDDRFPVLRLIELGSETVHASDVRLYQRNFSEDCKLIVNLGGSEISPICQFLVHSGSRIEGSTVPAGYAVEDVELLLWDTQGKPVDPGAAGEIVVRSRYLCLGYWGRPELTEAAFVPDPDGGDRRLFRTGDLGRLLPDGCLLHLGRLDLQVKIRGYRVEVAEVEACFMSTGLVREAAVTAWLDSSGEQNLVAWLVPASPDAPPTINELRARVTATLPDYMTPARFVFMDSLPVTQSGKLDRRALIEQGLCVQQSDTACVAPRTTVESRLKEIWSELLGRERVGIHENFFDLGGNSLLALQVVARISAAFRVMLPHNCLFEYSTLERLAAVVEKARSLEEDEVIRHALPGAESLLSFAQQRIWVLAEMGGASDKFNMVRAFQLEGHLDLVALDKALMEIGRRHANLRASFRMVGNGPVQVIAPESASVLSLVDLRHVAESQREAALDASITVANSLRFDIAIGPLWSVRVIRLPRSRQVLHLAMHHIISDDWSVQILLREISTIYAGFLAGVVEPIPKLPVQYTDYAAWQRRWLTHERIAKQIEYWQDHLRGAHPVTELPLDRLRQAGGDFRAGSLRVHVDRELTMRLRRLSRESETTLFVSLLAAYATLLSQYSASTDVVIGTALANRYPTETELLIGFFVSTIALRLKWREGAPFREIQNCAHRAAVNGYVHADVPFDQVVDALKLDRGAAYSPVFQTLFVMQNVPRQELAIPNVLTTPMNLTRPSAGATFDLMLSMNDTGAELCGVLEFNTVLFDVATIERMATNFSAILAGIVQDPDAVATQPPLPITGQRRRWLETASPVESAVTNAISSQPSPVSHN